MDIHTIRLLVYIAVFLIFSAFFSAAETAFSSVNKTHLRALAEEGNKRAENALNLAGNYDKLISTILIGNNIVNIALASVSTLLFMHIYEDRDLAATLSTIFATTIVLIFGEITPKSFAKDNSAKFALFATPFLKMLVKILTPVNYIFTKLKNFLACYVGKDEEENKMSQEELLLLLEDVQDNGTIDENEGELLKNALDFGDTEAQDILTHRVDLKGVEKEATVAEVAKLFNETHFSRLIVYENNIDKIIGIINAKDLYVDGKLTDKTLNELMTKPFFTHPSEKIDDLLKTLQQKKEHLAVVVDEYGGTLGIVTVEDILEELVGDIWDDHDKIENDFTAMSNDAYIVNCKANFEDFCEFFEIKAESNSTSVAGWVMEMMGKIPNAGETFEFENFKITVEKVTGNRIKKIKMVKK